MSLILDPSFLSSFFTERLDATNTNPFKPVDISDKINHVTPVVDDTTTRTASSSARNPQSEVMQPVNLLTTMKLDPASTHSVAFENGKDGMHRTPATARVALFRAKNKIKESIEMAGTPTKQSAAVSAALELSLIHI